MGRLLLLVACLAPTAAPAVETMRIAMSEDEGLSSVTLRAERLGFGEDSEEATFTPARGRSVEVQRADGKLLIDGAPWPGGDGESVRFRAEGAGAIRAGPHEVRGDVVVRLWRGGLQLINVIPLETYLAAVLGSEMPRAFPLEALKAQAVAARTYALYKKLEAYGQPYHLGSSVLSQVYGGVAQEDERTHAAVEATRGEVLTFELAPIEAYFHASCGGHTETGLDALNRDLPYLRSVDCPCGRLPASSWSLSLGARELRQVAGDEAPDFQVISRTGTGRARRVKLAPGRSVDAVGFRAKLGYTRVKSLAFDVERLRDGGVRLTGRGYGHGAGLCQWGAKALADDGKGYREILSHYYPGAELQQLY